MIATLIDLSKKNASQYYSSARDDLRDPAQWQLLVFFACSLIGFFTYKVILLNPAKEDGEIYTIVGSFVFALFLDAVVVPTKPDRKVPSTLMSPDLDPDKTSYKRFWAPLVVPGALYFMEADPDYIPFCAAEYAAE